MGGAPSLPTASTPGYGTMRGLVGCTCVIEFLTVAEQLGLARGLILQQLDLVQLTGDADASGGVHSLGSAFDVRQRSDPWVRIFREMGAAFYPREDASWRGNEHGHGVIVCPHDARSEYQFTAYRRGYNGLGKGPAGSTYAGQWGYGAKDPEWRPSVIRSTAQGLAWARAEIQKEQDMAITDADAQKIADKVWAKQFTSPTDRKLYAVSSYLIGANVKAGQAVAQTDTLEASMAKVQGIVDNALAPLQTELDRLSQLVQLGAGGPDVADVVTKVREALEGLTFQLDAVDQADPA